MAIGGDSVATVQTKGKNDRAVQGLSDGAVSAHLPVFGAFNDLGLTGRDIAELSGVGAPTVSRWRTAKLRIAGDKLAFLTLVLAHLLDEVDETAGPFRVPRARVDPPGDKGPVAAARAGLALQDVLNRDLAANDVYMGAQRFRAWWASGAPLRLREKRFQPQAEADILHVLKQRRTRT